MYPLFQAGKSLSSKNFLFLEMSLSSKVFLIFRDKSILCSCRQGRLSSVFRQGRVYPLKFCFRDEILSSVLSGREDFGIYVLIFGLSSVVSGREGFLAFTC